MRKTTRVYRSRYSVCETVVITVIGLALAAPVVAAGWLVFTLLFV